MKRDVKPDSLIDLLFSWSSSQFPSSASAFLSDDTGEELSWKQGIKLIKGFNCEKRIFFLILFQYHELETLFPELCV